MRSGPRNPIKEDSHMADLTDRQTQKYIRRGRGRPWKNFLWWLFGFFTPIVVFAAALSIAVFAVPVSTYTGGNNNYFIPEIANGTIFNFIQNYAKYTVADMPIVEQLLRQYVDQGEIGKYIEINYDKVNTIKLDGSSFVGKDFNINDYVKVTASIRSLGMTDQMGDFGKLSSFSSWEQVTEEVNPSDPNFNPKLYYYSVSEAQKSANARVWKKAITDPDGNTYARAFNDDGTLVEGAKLPYYYPALFDLPLFDMTQVIGVRIGTSSATSLFSVFGIAEDSMIGKIVAGRTVTGLGKITTADIKLNTVMDVNSNEKLAKIMSAVTGVEDVNDITLADLEHDWDTSAIKISTVMDVESNDKLNKILTAVTGKNDAKDITLGDLEGEWDTGKIKLSTVLDLSENEKLSNILLDVTGKESVDAITLGDLEADLNTDNIRLSTFLPESDNKNLYDIIRSAQGLPDGSEVKVGDLNGMNTDNIKMTVVIPNDDDSQDLYRILSSCCRDEMGNPKAPADITVGDVHKLDSNNALLKDLLKDTAPDSDMAKILANGCYRLDEDSNKYHVPYEELTVGDLSSFDVKTVKLNDVVDFDYDTLELLADGASYTGDINDMTIQDIEGFNVKFVKLTKVLNETAANEKLFSIFEDSLGKTRDQIIIDDLNDFDINSCKLNTVLSETNNEKLYNILSNATGKANDQITIQDLDDGINFDNVKLTSIMDYAGNEQMFDILVECTTATTPDEVTIGALSTFNTGDLHLTTVLPYAGNEKMYDILVECTSATNYSEVTINALSTFNTDNLHLTTVMPYVGNEKMFDILVECTSATSASDVTIAALSTFDTSTMHLNLVLDPADNSVIYNILREGLGKASNDDITIADFGNFDLSTVQLSSILTDKNGNPIVTSNAILDKLRDDPTVNVGNIGAKFDAIKLYDSYGEDVFVTDSSKSVRGDKYRRVDNGNGTYNYVRDNAGTYYISKEANIWLLFCYDVVSTDANNGCATEFAPSTLTFKNLTDGDASVKFTESTIYNLIACGIISEGGTPYDNKVTKLTINGVIDKVNEFLPYI